MAEKFCLGSDVRKFRLGESFTKNPQKGYHTIRYDFKPASVDTSKVATVEIGQGHQITVTVPNVEGSGTSQTVYKGSKKPYQKECVFIIDHITGEIVLEKLSNNIQIKRTRAEGSSKFQTRPITPVDANISRKPSPPQKQSPTQRSSRSPVQRTSPNQTSPGNRISPASFSQKSPANQRSPTMPGLVPPPQAKIPTFANPSMPILVDNEDEPVIAVPPEIGVLTDSSSDSSSSGSSSSGSSSESSDSEDESKAAEGASHKEKDSNAHATNGTSINNQLPNAYPGVQRNSRFGQLSEDLHLSEDESESD